MSSTSSSSSSSRRSDSRGWRGLLIGRRSAPRNSENSMDNSNRLSDTVNATQQQQHQDQQQQHTDNNNNNKDPHSGESSSSNIVLAPDLVPDNTSKRSMDNSNHDDDDDDVLLKLATAASQESVVDDDDDDVVVAADAAAIAKDNNDGDGDGNAPEHVHVAPDEKEIHQGQSSRYTSVVDSILLAGAQDREEEMKTMLEGIEAARKAVAEDKKQVPGKEQDNTNDTEKNDTKVGDEENNTTSTSDDVLSPRLDYLPPQHNKSDRSSSSSPSNQKQPNTQFHTPSKVHFADGIEDDNVTTSNDNDNDKNETEQLSASPPARRKQDYWQALRDAGREKSLRKRKEKNMIKMAQELHARSLQVQEQKELIEKLQQQVTALQQEMKEEKVVASQRSVEMSLKEKEAGETKIRLLQDEVAKLQASLTETQETNRQQQDIMAQLRTDWEKEAQQRETKNKEEADRLLLVQTQKLESVQAELQVSRGTCARLQEEMARHQATIQVLQTEKQQLVVQVQEFEQKATLLEHEHQARYVETNQELTNAQTQLKVSQQRESTLQTTVAELKQQIASKERAALEFYAQLDASTQHATALQKELAQKQDTATRLAQELATTVQEKDVLQVELNQQLAAANKLEAELATAKNKSAEQVRQLQDTILSQKEDMNGLESQLAATSQRSHEIQEEAKEQQDAARRLEQELVAQLQEKEQLQKDLNDKLVMVSHLQKEKQTMATSKTIGQGVTVVEASTNTHQMTELQQEMETKLQVISCLETELAESTGRVQQLEKDVDGHMNAVGRLERELMSSRQVIEKLQKELNDRASKMVLLESLRFEVDSLKGQLEVKEGVVRDLKALYADEKKKSAEFVIDIQSKKSLIAKLEKRLGETSRQTEKLEQQLRNKESQLLELKEQTCIAESQERWLLESASKGSKVQTENVKRSNPAQMSKPFLFRLISTLALSVLVSSAAGFLYAKPQFVTKEHWCAPVRPGTVLQVGQDQSFGGTAPWWKNHIPDSKFGDKMARWLETAVLSCPASSMANLEWKKSRLTIHMGGIKKFQSYRARQGARVDATQIVLFQQNGKRQVIDVPW